MFRGANSRVLRGGDGEQRTRVDSTRSFVRQVRRECFFVRVCHFGRGGAFCFSRLNRLCADWDDLLGDLSAQGSLFQAVLTGVIPPQKRSTAFGLFDSGYGIAWFIGSAIMGLLYGRSVMAVALFSMILQLAAIPVIFIANR